MLGYLGLAWLISAFSYPRRRNGSRLIINRIFDSATFAGSAMLLVGLVNPTVLKLIGNTKPFLLVGGLVGVAYSLRALIPDADDR